jgi:hypothetical protein
VSPSRLHWKIGVELELLAPRGLSRRTLAEALAKAHGGGVTPFFHQQSELSLVPDTPVFDNLTLGFAVSDSIGKPVAQCVDDLTLVDDLDRTQPSKPGWFRIVSDDARLLRLIARNGRADAGKHEALAPVAALFGTKPEHFEVDDMVRIADEIGAPIAIAAPLPGERERPCELITPPLETDHAARLEALLAPARALGFTLAKESATHIHFDAAPLRTARAVQDLVRILEAEGEALKQRMGVNPHCRRLGPWPAALRETIAAADFADLPWPQAQARLKALNLTKYCDFNLKNFIHDVPGKPTFEVRILPGLMEAAPILEAAARIEALLRRASA